MDWNAKVGNQDISRITSKFDLEFKMKQGKGYQSLPRECTIHNKHPIPTAQEATLHSNITRWEMTVAQMMKSLMPNSDLNWRKPLDHSDMTKSNAL